MRLLTSRAMPIIGWLLASLGALMAALYCAARALKPLMTCVFSSVCIQLEGWRAWGAASLLCGGVCFACALRFADSGKNP